MKILVLNCGSSSVKYQLFKMEGRKILAKGIAERIGENISYFTYKTDKVNICKKEVKIVNHEQAIAMITDYLCNNDIGEIKHVSEIDAIGHRLVHGGEEFSNSVKITQKVIDVLKKCIELAPLHNPSNIQGVQACQKLFPDTPQCGLFDTAFHQTMPKQAYLYALPLKFYREYKIRKYGFHGTSHLYVAHQAAEYIGEKISELKLITCHLGNGASITAINKGKSVDTSMGFTPLEGLVMGTRCGDIDPAIPLHLMQRFNMSISQVNTILNKKSGMLGLSEISNDMRVIEQKVEENNEKAILALKVYAYRLKKYISAYIGVLNGIDAIIFTGGVGENMPLLRKMTLSEMDYLGIELDEDKNNQFVNGIIDFTGKNSKVHLLKIPTNEELMIALETEKIVKVSP